MGLKYSFLILFIVTNISRADYKSKYPVSLQTANTPAGSAPNRNGLLGSDPYENSKGVINNITQNILRFNI